MWLTIVAFSLSLLFQLLCTLITPIDSYWLSCSFSICTNLIPTSGICVLGWNALLHTTEIPDQVLISQWASFNRCIVTYLPLVLFYNPLPFFSSRHLMSRVDITHTFCLLIRYHTYTLFMLHCNISSLIP